MNRGLDSNRPGKLHSLTIACAIGLVLLLTSEPPVVSHGQEMVTYKGSPSFQSTASPKKEVYKLMDSAKANTQLIITNDMTTKQYTEYIRQQALTIQEQNQKLDSLELH